MNKVPFLFVAILLFVVQDICAQTLASDTAAIYAHLATVAQDTAERQAAKNDLPGRLISVDPQITEEGHRLE